MKKLIGYFVFALFLYACQTPQQNEKPKNIVVKFDADTTADTTRLAFYNDTVSDLFTFNVNTNYTVLNEFIAALNQSKSTQVFITNPYCLGDCCHAYKKLSSDKLTLYIFKTACGEYGFNDDEFLFSNKQLTIVHHFSYSIHEFATDSLPALFKMEEEIIDMSSSTALVMQRKKITGSLSNYSITDVNFETANQNKQTTLQAQNKIFNDFITSQKLKDE
jgi:hypothetical protein